MATFPAYMTPTKFTLRCERRDDGGLRVTCDDLSGLMLSGLDVDAVMRDVLPAIDTIMRHNEPPKKTPEGE